MIYLDNQATTPLAPEAREAMLRWLGGPESDGFGNPHSSHRLGRLAEAAVELAREQVAGLLPPGGKMIFTSGATEALNMAIRGTRPGASMAVSAIEHSAVLNTARSVAGALAVLPVDRDGLVDPQAELPRDVGLVSVMQVNNEIGTLQPVDALGERVRAAGALFVCDAVQGAGKIAPPQQADLIALSAHKLYGPKGIGALWIRDGVVLAPVVTGGGQEEGLRSGTLSPALCAGFGAAAKLAKQRMAEDAAHFEDLFELGRSLFTGWTLNGSATLRWKGNLNLHRAGIDVPRLMSDCRQICFSAGSACASETKKPSRILSALGLTPEQAKGSIRIGLGRYTTSDELEQAAAAIQAAAAMQE